MTGMSARRTLATITAITFVLIAGGVVWGSTRPAVDLVSGPVVARHNDTFTVQGTLTVNCASTCEGYGDIVAGAQVEVVNDKQQTLAVSSLAYGGNASSYSYSTNSYTFTVPGVPRGEKLYGVHIGNQNRGVIWKNEHDAESVGFQLTLG